MDTACPTIPAEAPSATLPVTIPITIPITQVTAHVFTIPTDSPESDGTLSWSSTTMVLVQITAGDDQGTGWSYSDASAAALIRDRLTPLLLGHDALNPASAWTRMREAMRNLGVTGVVAMAIAAVDTALWDLKARLLGLPLVRLLGDLRGRMPVYGSGGFISYDSWALQAQIDGWLGKGITQIKIKVGSERDIERVREARTLIGPDVRLFVDANGAFTCKQALAIAQQYADEGVVWFEEPVPSWDVHGLHDLCRSVPPGMEVAAGEYAWSPCESKQLLDARAIDVLQADVTRCQGITGFLQVGVLCETAHIDLSSHCAPALHLHPTCALSSCRHMEYFHDHVRIEQMLFAGIPEVIDGCLTPDRTRPGMGIEVKWADAERYRV